MPPDFDLHAYLKWNPELRSAGISTLQQACEHYAQYGHAQRLVYKEFNMTLRYALAVLADASQPRLPRAVAHAAPLSGTPPAGAA